MLEFWKPYPNIQKKLNKVHDFILKESQLNNPEIAKVLQDVLSTKGKMLRPALFFLFADLNPQTKTSENKLIEIAASIELLHLATLVHDDIIDDSPLRRNTITLQAKYGKDVAVYAGDYLFTVFFELLVKNMENTPYLTLNAKAMKRILLGELGQMESRFNITDALPQYLDNIRGKTAELFWLTCSQGAYFSGGNPQLEKVAGEIGENIGLAFQIQDDILDYTASKETLKKPILEDLAQGVYTLPLILAYEKAPEEFSPYLNKKRALTIQDAKALQKLVSNYDGVTSAKTYVTNYLKHAEDLMESLPESPGKRQLLQITQHLIKRKF